MPGKSFPELGIIRSVKINSKGTKISIICLNGSILFTFMNHEFLEENDSLPSDRIYMYDVESDKLEAYSFESPFYVFIIFIFV